MDGSSTLCAACGTANRDGARFCDSCGTSLAVGGDHGAEARKVVTVLFADLVGSTAFEENLDPEGVRRVVGQLHDLLRRAVVDHGGRVVKTTGDGLMAVFGVPLVREDDAERAVRAAAAMQADFARFAASLHTRLGAGALGLRVGVNTGEVVVSAVDDDIIGDPVNTAARLEQAAAPGTVLIGPGTERLVRGRVVLEAVAPLALKGKQEAVDAWRLPAVLAEPVGDSEAPIGLVGRERELAELHDAFERVLADRTAHLVTVVGSPGVGKSRLVTESTTGLAERARLLRIQGRPEGGTGLTPVTDGLRAFLDLPRGASTDEVRSRLPGELWADDGDGDRVLALVRALLDGDPIGAMEETSWAVRRVLEASAREAPVVVVVDDLHWTEAVVLDLVEHLARWLRDAPVLLVAVTRPELAERRADLTAAPHTVLRLAGLAPDSCRRLAHELLRADDLPDAVVERALRASEGNPLFLREVLRMLVDDGVLRRAGEGWTLTVDASGVEVPPTINAVLAARIDQLTTDERVVLERAAVIGRSFTTDVLASLLPPRLADADEVLRRLCERELVDRVPVAGTAGEYRFHHALIRDAAYGRLLKEVRTELHERLAEQVAATGDDELAGWHLEQAVGYRREVGLGEESVIGALAARAGEHLGRAGRRSLGADDPASAAALLGRAVAALRSAGAERATLLLDRGDALLSLGDLAAADDVLDELGALTGDDPLLRAGADTLVAQLNALRSPGSLTGAVERAGRAASVLLAAGDDRGAARAESVHAQVLAALGRFGACEAALDRALAAARRVGDQRRANAVLALAPVAALWGPSPVARASGRCLDVIRVLRITRGAPHVEAHALRCQAGLEAMRDRPDAAQRMLAIARSSFEDLGDRVGLLESSSTGALVALYADDLSAAEQLARDALAGYEAMGARTQMLTATSLLARTLLEAGRVDEAAAVVAVADPGEDVPASITLASVRAQVLAESGELVQAEAAGRAGVELAAATDALVHQAFAHLGMARVLARAGRGSEAVDHARLARALYAAKGSVVGERAAVAIAGAGTVGPAAAGGRREARVDEVESSPAAPYETGIDGGQLSAPPVPSNLATEAERRWADTFNRGEQLAPDRFADAYRCFDHRYQEVFDVAATTRSRRLLSRAVVECRVTPRPIAVLGRRHSLAGHEIRSVGLVGLDAGSTSEIDSWRVTTVDDAGLLVRNDVFPIGELHLAVAALYEARAGDGEVGAGAAAALRRRARLIRTFGLLGEDPDDAFWTDVRPDVAVIVSGSSGVTLAEKGREALRRLVGAFGVGTGRRVLDVVAQLGEHDLLVRVAFTPIVAGTVVAADQLILFRTDPDDGRLAAVEIFLDHDAEALALRRVAELGEREDPPPARRPPRPNLASAAHAACNACINAGRVHDDDLFAPDFEAFHHPTRLRADLAQLHRSQRLGLRTLLDLEVDDTLVASLGDRHAVVATTMRHRGVRGLSEGSPSNRLDHLVVSTGPDGLIRNVEVFDEDQCHLALAELWSRHAEDLPGPEREAARRRSQLFGLLGASRDEDWYAAVATHLDPSYEAVSHVPAPPTGGVESGSEQIEGWRAAQQVLPNRPARLRDVLAHDERGLAVFVLDRAVEMDGEVVDHELIALFDTTTDDGRVRRVEAGFATAEAALERYDELAAAPEPASRKRRLVPNSATAAVDDLARRLASGDAEVAGAVGLADLDSLPAGPLEVAPLTTAGRRLALVRLTAGPTVRHLVVAVDDDGNLVPDDRSVPGELHLRLARLFERRAEELDGPEREAWERRARLAALIAHPSDDEYWQRFADLASPSMVVTDRSTLRLFVPGDVDRSTAFARWQREAAVMASSGWRLVDIVAGDGEGIMVLVMGRSDSPTGEAVSHEAVFLVGTGEDGRVELMEGFSSDADALARYDELVAVREAPSQ